MGRMEPGAAGATQAGRHTQTTGYMWSRNAAGAAGGVSAAALGRNVGIQVKGGPAAQVLRPAMGPTNFLTTHPPYSVKMYDSIDAVILR